jgi:uncharacterized protein
MRPAAKVILVVLLIYIIPVLLLLFSVIPYQYRFYVLELTTLVLLVYARFSKISFRQLGFRMDNIQVSILNLVPVTLGLSTVMLLVYFFDKSKPTLYGTMLFYLFYVFISSPSQEFIYRGFLFELFSGIELGKAQKIIFSSILYSFVHIIYLDLATLVVTFMMGLIWGYSYNKSRNIFSVSLSHSIIGAISILLGFV